MHGPIRPPTKKHEERHPPERELDGQVDRAPTREHRGDVDFLVGNTVVHRLTEEDNRHCAIGREGHNGQEDEPKPLLPDATRFAHELDALYQLSQCNEICIIRETERCAPFQP